MIMDDDVEELHRIPVEEMNLAEMHLLLGDSMAVRLGPRLDVRPPHILLERPRGGNTWGGVVRGLEEDIRCWREAAASFRCRLGVAVLWLTGNDLYPRAGTAPAPEELEVHISAAVDTLRQVAKSVVILGPLPRFRVDAGMSWTDCAAYQHERQLTRLLRDVENVKLVVLGRYLTKTLKRWRIIGNDSRQFFSSDEVHLSGEGEDRILAHLPAWLRWSPEQED